MMDIADRALHLHGALGASNEMPVNRMLATGISFGLADGPTEVHKDDLARQLLRTTGPHRISSQPALPTRMAAAEERYADYLEQHPANA